MKNPIVPALPIALLFAFTACTGNYYVTKLDEKVISHTETIAVSFFQAAAPAISFNTTSTLLSEIKQYGYESIISPEQVEKVLKDGNIDLYRNPSSAIIFQIGQKVKARYLIAGSIHDWEGGYWGLSGQRLAKVGFSLRMYDLDTGKEVWFGSAEDDEGFTLFGIHTSPNDLMRDMLRKLLKDTTLKRKKIENDFF